MARAKAKTPGRAKTGKRTGSPAVKSPGKSPMTPGWTSAKASMFLSPKSPSPAVTRRVTRRSSVFHKKTTVSLTGRKSPAVKSPATKERIIGEVEFKAPMSKASKIAVLKSTTSISPAMTRSRRSSVYQKAGKKAVASPGPKSSPKNNKPITRTRQTKVEVQSPVKKKAPKRSVSPKKPSPKKKTSKRKSESPSKPAPAKISKSSKTESSEETKIPKPTSKSARKTTPKQKISPKKSSPKKSTPKGLSGKSLRSESPAKKSESEKTESPQKNSAAKKSSRSASPKKSSPKKITPKRRPSKRSVSPQKSKAAVAESPAKSPSKTRNVSRSPPRKRRSISKPDKLESPAVPRTPRLRSDRTPKPSSTKKTPISTKKIVQKNTPSRQTVAALSRTPKATPPAKTPKVIPAVKEPKTLEKTPSRARSPVKKTPLRAKSPVKKTPSRAKSPVKKTPSRAKSPVKKTPSRARSPVKKTPSRGKSPARNTPARVKTPSRKPEVAEVITKSVKKVVTISPPKTTPTTVKVQAKRVPTPFVKSPPPKTPGAKAVKVLGITPRSSKIMQVKKSQRLVGRTPPRTSTPMGDRKRQAVFDPEVSTIRVKRTRKSTIDVVNTHTINEEDTIADLNVNNNADESAIPSAGWSSWCTIL